MDTTTKNNHTAESKSKQRRNHPRPKRHIPKVFGYALKDAWIIEYAVRHNLGSEEDVDLATERVLLKIMGDTRIGDFCTVKCDNGGRDTGLCLQLGNNWSPCGMQFATKEKIETAKRVLDMTEDPQWYGAD